MDFERWSWTAYGLGVATVLVPSVVAFIYFLLRAPVMDDEGRIVRDNEPTGRGSERRK